MLRSCRPPNSSLASGEPRVHRRADVARPVVVQVAPRGCGESERAEATRPELFASSAAVLRCQRG
eukprot:3875156-Lingulodinium_polyedra.AAC.1